MENERAANVRADGYAIILTDEAGVITVADGAFLPWIVGDEKPVVGRPIAEVLNDTGRLRDRASSALGGRSEYTMVAVDDKELDVRFEPRVRTGGAPAGVAVIAVASLSGPSRDALDSRRLYARGVKLLFRQVPGAMWTTDRDLKLVSIVGREMNVLGTPIEDLLGQTIQDFVHSDDPSHPVIAHHLAALAGKSTSFRHSIGHNVYEAQVEPLRDGKDVLVGTIGVAINVTGRQRAEDELTRSRLRLVEAQRLAHVGSWEWDVDHNVISWSDELHRIYGLPVGRGPATFEDFLALVHPEDMEPTRAAIFDALRSKKPLCYSHRIRRADGSVRMLQTRGDSVLDEGGRVVRLAGSCWDTTEQWEAVRKLERTASLLRATLDATAEGVLVVDRAGRIAVHNQRFLSLWSIPEEVAKSGDDNAMLDVVTNQLEDPDGFLRRVQDLYAAPEAHSFDMLRFKDGRVFERSSIPQRLKGEVAGRVWSFRDVTERERMYRRAEFLSDAGRLLASLDIEKALESVARLTVPYMGDGCAVDLLNENGGARRLLLIQRDPNRPVRSELPRAVLAGRPLIYSIDSGSYMSIPLPGRTTLFGVLTFIAASDRRYSDVDLELAEELARRISLAIENAHLYRGAQEALRVREEFLSIAAHEFRGPITSIHLSVQSLRRTSLDSPTAGKLLEVIEREDRQLTRLVDELLDVSRIRGGRMHFDLERVDICEVTRDVIARLSPELTRSGSSLSFSSGGELIGLWDRARLDQVVMNLLSNAIKFGLGKPIELSLSGTDGRVTLVVRDHGIGVDPNMQDQIFDPFARAVPARHYGGLGLGLYIVRTIVEGLGGTVRLESEPNEGSCFIVDLPRASQHEQQGHDSRRG